MKEEAFEANLTVEAIWTAAMILLSVSVIPQQAARTHDETKAAMGLHGAVERGHHGSVRELEASASRTQEHMDRLMPFTDCNLMMEEKGQRIYGVSRDRKWKREIETEKFRPEIFLRKITLIEGLVKEGGN